MLACHLSVLPETFSDPPHVFFCWPASPPNANARWIQEAFKADRAAMLKQMEHQHAALFHGGKVMGVHSFIVPRSPCLDGFAPTLDSFKG